MNIGAASTAATKVFAESDRASWLSAYLPIHGGIYEAACDDALRDLVAPTIEASRSAGLIHLAFFVRYIERWPHIRLRLLPTSVEAEPQLVELVERAWRAHVDRHASALRPPEIEWVEYVAETERYGGTAALLPAERLFDGSTTFALHQLTADFSRDRSLRLGRAMLAMLVLLHEMLDRARPICEFVRQYSSGYLSVVASKQDQFAAASDAFIASHERQAAAMVPYVDSAWESLEASEPLTPSLDAYRDSVQTARRELEALSSAGGVQLPGRPAQTWATAGPFLVSSFAHMTSNRLGVSIFEEAYIASVIQKFLEVRLER